jgi:hypothetical protein
MRSKQRGKQSDAVLNLTYYFEALLLLSHDVNSSRLCFINSEAECDAILNLTLTYGKQNDIFN